MLYCLPAAAQPFNDSCSVLLTHQHHPGKNNDVRFIVEVDEPIEFLQWSIEYPDGRTDSLHRDRAYTFPYTGTYVAKLMVLTQPGCMRTVYDTVEVSSIGKTNFIPCYPNPTTNMASLHLWLEETLKIVVTVYNTSGVEVKSLVSLGWKGSNLIEIPVKDLRPGQYFIQIVLPETYPVQRKSSIFQKL